MFSNEVITDIMVNAVLESIITADNTLHVVICDQI